MIEEFDGNIEAIQTRQWITVIIGGLLFLEMNWPYTNVYTTIGTFVLGAFLLGVPVAMAAQYSFLNDDQIEELKVTSWWQTIGWLAAFYFGFSWFW
tara:strand:- start:844 stop:1131 length:288 start_codon:yes stop_codon:yes gene_type:complete